MGEEHEKLGREEAVNLERLVRQTEARCSSLRSLNRIVKGIHFHTLWEGWSVKQRTVALDHIEKGELVALKKILTHDPDLGEMSLRQLRESAKRARMPCYSRADHEELILYLERHITK